MPVKNDAPARDTAGGQDMATDGTTLDVPAGDTTATGDAVKGDASATDGTATDAARDGTGTDVSAGDAKASWLWLTAYFVVITIGELYLSPTALALVSKVAPAGFLSMMMGVWLATSFYGSFLAGYLGSLWSGMAKPHFFLMIAVIAAAAGVAIFGFKRPLSAILKE